MFRGQNKGDILKNQLFIALADEKQIFVCSLLIAVFFG